MKFGIDFHGVINKNPSLFVALSHALVDAGHEVHIITGPRRSIVEPQLRAYGISFTHFFSIVEYEEARGLHNIEWIENNPFMDRAVWDLAKSDYCREQGIDLHIDDSTKYGEHFTTPFAHFRNEGHK